MSNPLKVSRHIWHMGIRTGLILCDTASLTFAFTLLDFNIGSAWFILPVIIIWFSGLWILGRYNPDGSISRVDESFQVFKIALIIAAFGIFLEAIQQLELPIKTLDWLLFSCWLGAGDILLRSVLRSFQKVAFRYGLGCRQTIIIGTGSTATELGARIMADPSLGYELQGTIAVGTDRPAESPAEQLGELIDLPDILISGQVDHLIIALEDDAQESILPIMAAVGTAPIGIEILPDMYEVVSGMARTEQVAGLPLVRLNTKIFSPFQALVKRMMDLVLAVGGLILFSPLMVIIAIMIKATSPGSVIFSQDRIGFNGATFKLHKFRTMIDKAETATGPVWAREDDPRITQIGRWLRRLRLDEIPQLINVVLGQMTLVGPRPERPHFVEMLKTEFPYYTRRMLVRPGLTGWAQVRGNYDASLEDVRRKLKDDFFYIDNVSFRLDLKIILMTIGVVLSGRGR